MTASHARVVCLVGSSCLRWTSLLALAGAIAACDGNASSSEGQRAGSPSDSVALVEPESVTTDAPVPAPPVEPVPALDGEGLRLVDPVTGSTRPLPFGSSRDAVLRALLSAYPGEEARIGESFECSAEYVEWTSGLTLWIDNSRFVGWGVRDSDLTTMSGIGLGSSRAELQSVYQTEIFESSLGTEFVAGGLSGLLDSDRDDATIAAFWAGTTCIAR